MLELLLPYTSRGLTDEPDFPGNPGSLSFAQAPATRLVPLPARVRSRLGAARAGRAVCPAAGDIFLATDQRLWFRWGHLIAGANGVHHSGIVFALPDGELRAHRGRAIRQAAGRDDGSVSSTCPSTPRLGDRVWVRRRRCPLTPEQSARLTAFACAQEGKPFALARWFGQLTPLRTPRSDQDLVRRRAARRPPAWFCSELVTECCVAAGIMDRADRQARGNLSQRPVLGPLLQPLPQPPPRTWSAGLVPAGPMAARAALSKSAVTSLRTQH